jgi:hypothetical protein
VLSHAAKQIFGSFGWLIVKFWQITYGSTDVITSEPMFQQENLLGASDNIIKVGINARMAHIEAGNFSVDDIMSSGAWPCRSVDMITQ